MVEQEVALAPVEGDDLEPVTNIVEEEDAVALAAGSEAVMTMRKCDHCDFEYDMRLPFTYANHIRHTHPDQTKKAQEQRRRAVRTPHDGSAPPAPTATQPHKATPDAAERPAASPSAPSVPTAETVKYVDSLSPMGQRLHEAATRVLGSTKAALVRQMVTIYERNTQVLGDRHRFRSWGVRYALTTDQLAQIEDDIFGLDEGAAAGGTGFLGSAGQPVVGYGPNGMPQIVYIQGPAAPESSAAAAPIIMPYPQQQGSSAETVALREELRELRSEMRSILRERQGGGSAQMRRVPMLDEVGELITDANGNVLYQEVPHDPQASALEVMKTAMMFAQAQQGGGPAFDEEKQQLQIEKAVRDAAPVKTEIPEEVRSQIDTLRTASVETLNQLRNLEKEKEIKDEVERAIGPFVSELRESRAAQGLSEAQYLLKHKEAMADNARGLVTGLFDGLRGDLKPLMLQQFAAQMKAVGVSDEVISGAMAGLAQTPQISSSSPLRDKMAAAHDKWFKSPGS